MSAADAGPSPRHSGSQIYRRKWRPRSSTISRVRSRSFKEKYPAPQPRSATRRRGLALRLARCHGRHRPLNRAPAPSRCRCSERVVLSRGSTIRSSSLKLPSGLPSRSKAKSFPYPLPIALAALVTSRGKTTTYVSSRVFYSLSLYPVSRPEGVFFYSLNVGLADRYHDAGRRLRQFLLIRRLRSSDSRSNR